MPDGHVLRELSFSGTPGQVRHALDDAADEIERLREVILQANRLGVIYEDFDRIVILHDDIDTTEVVHPDAVRRALEQRGEIDA